MNNEYMMNVLTWFSVILQLQNYEEELKSATNGDIDRHLAEQDSRYLDKMMETLNEISQKLDLLLADKG